MQRRQVRVGKRGCGAQWVPGYRPTRNDIEWSAGRCIPIAFLACQIGSAARGHITRNGAGSRNIALRSATQGQPAVPGRVVGSPDVHVPNPPARKRPEPPEMRWDRPCTRNLDGLASGPRSRRDAVWHCATGRGAEHWSGQAPARAVCAGQECPPPVLPRGPGSGACRRNRPARSRISGRMREFGGEEMRSYGCAIRRPAQLQIPARIVNVPSA